MCSIWAEHMTKSDDRDKTDIAFGQALKQCRKFKGKTQESFGDVSSRTYISQIERGVSAPTLKKIEMLAKELELEPATMVALCYLKLSPEKNINQLLSKVKDELQSITNTK